MCCYRVVPAVVPGLRREIPSFHGGRPLYVPSCEGFVLLDALTQEYVGQYGARSRFRSDLTPWERVQDANEAAYELHGLRRPGEPFGGVAAGAAGAD